jgi:hypothetical protein
VSRHSITLFMWGYQSHFRFKFEYLMDSVMKELGVHQAGGKCLLVGAKIPGADVHHDVCVEPEDGQWPLALFAELPASIEEIVKTHPLQNMFYSDEATMRDRPENMRRDSVRQAVQAALVYYDAKEGVRSFEGAPAPVGGYYVVPILQLPNAIFERFRSLREPVTDGYFTGIPSLIHAAVKQVLSEAYDELLRPDPGRYISGRSASPGEIVRRAASNFMYTPGIAIGDKSYGGPNLFERFNLISSLMYEGAEGKGRMLLANPDGGAVDVALALAEPVPFREPRWSRKVLQMASSETALLANCESILGLGNVSQGTDPWATQNVFEVEFHDHYHWSLSCGDEVLLVSRYGAPSLPQERFPSVRLVDTFQRLFPEATAEDIDSFTALFDVAVEQQHGSMLVVARDASEEATRLRGQGTRIAPTKLTPELYRRVSNIDGTIIIDSKCICHAVGVILDGPANELCTPSRGSRYNSGIRYVAASTTPRLAVVVSDDRTVDVIPVLRPRIRRSTVEEHVTKLEASTVDNYHAVIAWLDKHRFYLDESQCERVNAAQKRLDLEPREVGEIRIMWPKFCPDLRCTADYFAPELGA